MKFTILALTAAYVAGSVAEAIPAPRPHENAPRYYFPRVVKRQVLVNSTEIDLSSSSQTSTSGLLDGVGDAIGGILDPSTTQDTAVAAPTSATTTGIGIIGLPDDAATPSPTPTTTNGPTGGQDPETDSTGSASSSDTGIVGPIVTDGTSAVGDLTSDLGAIVTPTTPTGGQPTTTGGNDNVPTDDPTAGPSSTTGVLPTLSVPSVTLSTVTLPTVAFPTTTPPLVTDDPTIGPTGGPSTTNEPTGDDNSPSGTPTTTQPPLTNEPTDQPTTPPTDQPTTTPSEPTDKPTDPPLAGGNNNTEPETSPTLPPTTPAFTPGPETTPTFTPSSIGPPQSIVPTGTDNATALIPDSTIQTAPPPATTLSDTKTAPTSTQTTMPSDVPRVITPEGGVPVPPEDSTLIQIAFKEGLHYEFVVGSQLAINQIFSYLPVGVSDGLNMSESKMVMQYLQPYNTLARLHYVTTLAMAYIPADEVDKLSMQILNANSELFENKDKSVKTLMDMIDPTVPLLAGQGLTPGGTPVSAGDGSNNADGNDGEDSSPGSDGGSSGVRPSSVGIAVGAVAGAAVYGAAMFLVARRYKKRKAAHQRASSVQTDETPRPGEGTNLMTGARNSYGSRVPGHMNGNDGRGSRNSDRSDESGRSGRTYISPPVMAENSLGWN